MSSVSSPKTSASGIATAMSSTVLRLGRDDRFWSTAAAIDLVDVDAVTSGEGVARLQPGELDDLAA